jgi:hypothetical protein
MTAAATPVDEQARRWPLLILSRAGVVEPNLVWKDMVLVRAGEMVNIAISPRTTRAA